jgi:hypothetical protein
MMVRRLPDVAVATPRKPALPMAAVSYPAPPSSVSSPAKPVMTSSAESPESRSRRFVPLSAPEPAAAPVARW